MNEINSQVKNWLLALSASVLLTGCSLSFIYNNLDWWVNWYLDDYVLLNDDQQDAFAAAFEKFHYWHRKNELKRYYAELTELKNNVSEGITHQQIADHMTNVKGFWDNLRKAAQPDLVSLTYTLSQAQRNELLESIAERNNEIKDERAELPRDKWIKKECAETQKDFREWVGKLTKTQKATICEQVSSYNSTFSHWMEYREKWRMGFSDALAVDHSKDTYQAMFIELIINPEQLRTVEHQRLIDENNTVFRDIFVELMNNLTKKQQNRFNNRIDDLIDDLKTLEARD